MRDEHSGLGTHDSWPDALPAGTALQGGHYSVGRLLGRGGFGITYLGGDNTLQRVVAIKEFFPDGCSRRPPSLEAQPPGSWPAAQYAAAKERFLVEGRTLARFDHPGIVRVFSLFEENNTAYMVMEYLKGQSLLGLLDDRFVLPEAKAVGYVTKMAAALDQVHREGLLHRDVKPENVVICDDGRVALIDFGLIKKVEQATAHGTRRLSTGTNVGTPAYAPLEQYSQADACGVATDVYSLGATLYHLLTGVAPLPSTDRANGSVLQSPIQVNPQVTNRASEAVMWALQLKAADRPQTMREFIEVLMNGANAAAKDQAARAAAPPKVTAPKGTSVPNGVSVPPTVASPSAYPTTMARSRPELPRPQLPALRRGTLPHAILLAAARGAGTAFVGGLLLGWVGFELRDSPVNELLGTLLYVALAVAVIGAAGGAVVGWLAARRPRLLSTARQPQSWRGQLLGALYRMGVAGLKGLGVGLVLGTVIALVVGDPLQNISLIAMTALEGALAGAIVGVIAKQIEDGIRRENPEAARNSETGTRN